MPKLIREKTTLAVNKECLSPLTVAYTNHAVRVPFLKPDIQLANYRGGKRSSPSPLPPDGSQVEMLKICYLAQKNSFWAKPGKVFLVTLQGERRPTSSGVGSNFPHGNTIKYHV